MRTYHLERLPQLSNLAGAGHFLLTSSSFTVWPTRLACAGHAGGAVFSLAPVGHTTFPNVVIGYGIIASVMTTDIDLERGGGLHCIAG